MDSPPETPGGEHGANEAPMRPQQSLVDVLRGRAAMLDRSTIEGASLFVDLTEAADALDPHAGIHYTATGALPLYRLTEVTPS